MRPSIPFGICLLFALCGTLIAGLPAPVAGSPDPQNQKPWPLPEVHFTPDGLKAFTALEPIDVHTHVTRSDPAFSAMLQRLHLHLMDVLVASESGRDHRKALQTERQDALNFIASSASHAKLCTTFDPYDLNDPDFAISAVESLDHDFAEGAVAVKIWKNVGMELKDGSGKYVMADDPRLAPIYRDIAAHHKTLMAHLAEPDECWAPRPGAIFADYYAENPQWDMSNVPGAPSKQRILQARDHVLRMNPDLRVIGAHLGSMEDDTDLIAERLEKYPNFAVDTAARMPNLVLQPRAKVRAFLLKFQDRIVYGTDLQFHQRDSPNRSVQQWENWYAFDWRYLASEDTFQYAGRQIRGLHLPRLVLRKIYHDNAVKWVPGILQ